MGHPPVHFADHIGGWPHPFPPDPSQLRVPHPLRFSKGGNLERLRDEISSVSIFDFKVSYIYAPNTIAKSVDSLSNTANSLP